MIVNGRVEIKDRPGKVDYSGGLANPVPVRRRLAAGLFTCLASPGLLVVAVAVDGLPSQNGCCSVCEGDS